MGETENLQDGCDRQKLVHISFQFFHFSSWSRCSIYVMKKFWISTTNVPIFFYRNSFWRQNSFHYVRQQVLTTKGKKIQYGRRKSENKITMQDFSQYCVSRRNVVYLGCPRT